MFQREVLPRMQGKPELWPSPYNTLPEFLTAAALVQSRAFHMESNNWVTGAHQVRVRCQGWVRVRLPGMGKVKEICSTRENLNAGGLQVGGLC